MTTRENSTETKFESPEEFWANYLSDLPQLHSLPTDKAHSATYESKHAVYLSNINAEVCNKLEALCQNENVSLTAGFQASLAGLLHRLTRESDIVIGMLCKPDEISPSVLRHRVHPQQTFSELLSQSSSALELTRMHRMTSFERLQKVVSFETRANYSPLFQVMLSLGESIDYYRAHAQGATVEQLSQQDMHINIQKTEQGLVITWCYNTNILNRDTIIRFSECFDALLKELISNPEVAIEELKIASESDNKLMEQWGTVENPYSSEKCIHELFDIQADTTPESIAVVYEKQSITYRDLKFRSNELANYLIETGVQPGMVIGLCVDRSIENMICFIGILKAGAVYLPLDPSLPQDRISYMLEDSQAPFVICAEQYQNLCNRTTSQILLWEEQIFTRSSELPKVQVLPTDSACIAYTSGSTGRPKGVELEHAGMSLHCQAIRDRFGITNKDNVLQFSKMSVDITLEQIFSAFLAGASLHITSQRVWSDIEFFDYVRENSIHIADLPPVYVQMLLNSEHNQHDFWKNSSLRLVIMGGEVPPPGIIQHWAEHDYFAHCSLMNVYGPAETTITSTVYDICPQDADKSYIPVGRPVAGRKLFVVNDALQATPIGVVGELYFGGPCVSKGYLNNPTLTSDKFITSPLNQNERWYRTGDLFRYLPSGELVFAGRIDDQVKIRGFRIELGEVESHLTKHHLIDDAEVLVNEVNGEKYLVAYLVTKQQNSTLKEKVKSYLKQSLPDYMIPSFFVFLSEFPMTLNGKLDKRALLAIELNQDPELYVAPQTQLEKTLVEIWSSVLNVDPAALSVQADFFELGGNSIKALKLLSRLKEQLAHNLDVKEFLNARNIQAVGSLLERTNLSDVHNNQLEKPQLPKMRRRKASK